MIQIIIWMAKITHMPHLFSMMHIEVNTASLSLEETQPANIGPQDVPRTSRSNVPRTSPKDPIWPSRGRLELTSWGRLEIMSWGCPNLTSRGRPWEIVSECPQDVLRTSHRRPWKHVLGTMWRHLLDVPKFLFTFLSELIRLTKSI